MTHTQDKTTTPTRANLLGCALAPLAAAVFIIPHALAWGGAPLWAAFDRMLPLTLALALGVVLHELLHGLGMVWAGGVAWSEVELGLRGLMPYAHCKVPLAASAYRVSIVLPGVVLGLVPGAVGVVWGQAWLTVYGALMTIAALGDVVILWLMRSVPGEARVQDHPSAPGCQVLFD